jgi:hypothetical protein
MNHEYKKSILLGVEQHDAFVDQVKGEEIGATYWDQADNVCILTLSGKIYVYDKVLKEWNMKHDHAKSLPFEMSLNDVEILLSALNSSDDYLRDNIRLCSSSSLAEELKKESISVNNVRLAENKLLHDKLLIFRNTLV